LYDPVKDRRGAAGGGLDVPVCRRGMMGKGHRPFASHLPRLLGLPISCPEVGVGEGVALRRGASGTPVRITNPFATVTVGTTPTGFK